MPIDRKFIINANCFAHGHTYTEEDGLFLKAADPAVPAALRAYRAECEKVDVDHRQLVATDLLIERVEKYQRDNPDKVKVADVDPGTEEEIVNKPNE